MSDQEPEEWSHLRAACALDEAARHARERVEALAEALWHVPKARPVARELRQLGFRLEREIDAANREVPQLHDKEVARAEV
jgi:hypothetical protein